MKWTIAKEFSFEAAHSLPHLPLSHPCHHLHGHSYKVIVGVSGDELHSQNAWVIDYADITQVVYPVIAELDHSNLNELLPVKTTAENLAKWLFDEIRKVIPGLSFVEVKETNSTSAVYSKDP